MQVMSFPDIPSKTFVTLLNGLSTTLHGTRRDASLPRSLAVLFLWPIRLADDILHILAQRGSQAGSLRGMEVMLL
ncbi:hypothetical protein E2C01_037782 [Portunus trituberculatus]|uniref:Uncharacterized protein n=1 Tax=Portunus trituberculatus TaxID=210409 RepID=A0A5B7FGQ9_PORTR|nr:hypothetical protein [Portunus trituberculatus]